MLYSETEYSGGATHSHIQPPCGYIHFCGAVNMSILVQWQKLFGTTFLYQAEKPTQDHRVSSKINTF